MRGQIPAPISGRDNGIGVSGRALPLYSLPCARYHYRTAKTLLYYKAWGAAKSPVRHGGRDHPVSFS